MRSLRFGLAKSEEEALRLVDYSDRTLDDEAARRIGQDAMNILAVITARKSGVVEGLALQFRIRYQILLLQGKTAEAEDLIRRYSSPGA